MYLHTPLYVNKNDSSNINTIQNIQNLLKNEEPDLTKYTFKIPPLNIDKMFPEKLPPEFYKHLFSYASPPNPPNTVASVEIDSPDIVFVGGGPVGLLTAIQMKLRTGKNITVIEKYNEYQRTDIRLNVAAKSLTGIPYDPVLDQLVKKWGGHAIPIKQMEDDLVKRAHELGIKILRGQAADPKLLSQQFPSAKLFIGADGAKSTMRQAISEDQFLFNTTHQYVAQVQYIIEPGKTDKPMSKLGKTKEYAKTYKALKFAEHLINTTITPQEDGSSKVTLQIFIDKGTYDKMQDATFKTPYYFETDLDKVPESLQEVLIKWWGSRELLANEVISQQPSQKNKITVLSLGSYAAKNFVKKDSEGKIWALVGDAAAAFPFFRAINNGFLLGTELARCTEKAFKKQNDSLQTNIDPSFFNAYSRYATWRVYSERIKASMKNFFLTMSCVWIKVSNFTPWNASKFSSKEKGIFYNRGISIWERLTGTQFSRQLPINQFNFSNMIKGSIESTFSKT